MIKMNKGKFIAEGPLQELVLDYLFISKNIREELLGAYIGGNCGAEKIFDDLHAAVRSAGKELPDSNRSILSQGMVEMIEETIQLFKAKELEEENHGQNDDDSQA